MPQFAYQARDRSGQVTSGTHEATDQRAALEALREDGLFVTKLQPTRDGVRRESPPMRESAPVAPPSTLPPSTRLPTSPTTATAPEPKQPFKQANAKQLSLYFRQMHAMVDAGTGLSQALALMGQHAPNKALQKASAEMSRRTATGTPWSETMQSYPGLFSELMIGMIGAGERGGFLDRMCQRLAEYSERDYEIQQTIKRETWYPKLLVFCAILIPSVVPLVLSGFRAWLAMVVPPLLAIGVLYVLWKLVNLAAPAIFHSGPLAYALDWLKLMTPVAGKTARALATAKFCRAFGALTSAGMGVGPTIEYSARACGNEVVAQRARNVIPQVESGMTMTQALDSTGVFPPITIQMLSVGEESGNVEVQLEKVATFLEQDAETTIKQSVKVLGILVFLGIALYIAVQVVSFYGGYTDQFNDIMNETG